MSADDYYYTNDETSASQTIKKNNTDYKTSAAQIIEIVLHR